MERKRELRQLTLDEIVSKIGPEAGDQYKEELANTDKGRREVKSWTVGFNLKQAFESTKGPFVEIAGPTLEGYLIADFSKLSKHVYTSNIATPGLPYYNQNGELAGFIGRVDFSADSTKLPLADNKVGALFGSCLQRPTIPNTLSEASRVVEDGGLLLLQSTFEDVKGLALSYNFSLRAEMVTSYKQSLFVPPQKIYDYIFQRQHR